MNRSHITYPRFRCRHRGLTLVELLVVVAIIGIAAGVLIPMITDQSDMRMRASTETLISDLLFAQTWAIANQRQCRIAFDTGTESYTVQDYAGATLNHPVLKTPYVMDYANHEYLRNVTLDTVSVGGGATLAFSSLGVPERPDGTDLTAPAAIIISSGGLSNTVTVEPVTGRIISP